MALALFVSESYIKAYTPIGSLVEWVEIEPTANLAQDAYIQDVLGSNFYTYLQLAYSAQTMNADEIVLMNYIKPALAHRVAEQVAPFVNYQFKNKGIMSQSGDYSQSVDLDTMKYVRQELANRAGFYITRLSNYLCENAALYPQYQTNNSTDMTPKDNGYDCGLAFY
jgi:hypothetical protein